MKKLSTALALGLAMALTFGMTAFAAESPTTDGVAAGEQVVVTEASVAVTNAVSDTQVAQISDGTAATQAGVDSSAQSISVFDLKLKEGQTIPEGGLKVTFTLPAGTFDTGSYDYYVLHFNGTAWEKVDSSVDSSEAITATFKSLSPIAIVSVEKDGDDDDDDDDTVAATVTTTADGSAASPKTADTASVAGIIALAALAGAAVTVRRTRFNK